MCEEARSARTLLTEPSIRVSSFHPLPHWATQQSAVLLGSAQVMFVISLNLTDIQLVIWQQFGL